MVKKTRLLKVGNSTGLIVPVEMLDALSVRQGDELTLTQENGRLIVSPFDPEFDRVMEAGEKVIRKYRNTLRRLGEGPDDESHQEVDSFPHATTGDGTV